MRAPASCAGLYCLLLPLLLLTTSLGLSAAQSVPVSHIVAAASESAGALHASSPAASPSAHPPTAPNTAVSAQQLTAAATVAAGPAALPAATSIPGALTAQQLNTTQAATAEDEDDTDPPARPNALTPNLPPLNLTAPLSALIPPSPPPHPLTPEAPPSTTTPLPAPASPTPSDPAAASVLAGGALNTPVARTDTASSPPLPAPTPPLAPSTAAAADLAVGGVLNAVPARAQGLLPPAGPTPAPPAPTPPAAYVAACAVVHNQHCNLLEWIAYHRWIGISKFYIFDYGSQPPLAQHPLADLITDGTVEYHYFTASSWLQDRDEPRPPLPPAADPPPPLTPQTWAYSNCLRWFGHRHTFIALLDASEYLMLPPAPRAGADAAAPAARPDAAAFLRRFESAGGVFFQWRLFGPSGHHRRPAGCTLASYTACIPPQAVARLPLFQARPAAMGRAAVRTAFWRGACGASTCASSEPYVLPDGRALQDIAARPVQYGQGSLHRYITRSREEFSRASRRTPDWPFFDQMAAAANASCPEAARLAAACCADVCRSSSAVPGCDAGAAVAAARGASAASLPAQ